MPRESIGGLVMRGPGPLAGPFVAVTRYYCTRRTRPPLMISSKIVTSVCS